MASPLIVRITDDRLFIADLELPRPEALTRERFAGDPDTLLAPHDDDLEDPEERRQRIDRITPEFLDAFGRGLFAALFADGVARQCYDRTPDAVVALDLPEDLRALPWELMHDGALWVSQSRGVVRLTDGDPAPEAGPTDHPLRVLSLIAMPVLDASFGPDKQPYVGSGESYAEAFRDLSGKDLPAEFTVVRHATPDDLRAGLEEGAEALYFLGHGHPSAVAFDDGQGRLRRVDRHTLRQRFQHSGLRLAVTNSCSTASHQAGVCPIAGMLVLAGVPVVVGMQVPVTDMAARVFAGAFFPSLARGRSPIVAVSSARQALQDAHDPDTKGAARVRQVQAWEWATPAVYVSRLALEAASASFGARGQGRVVVRDEVGERLRAKPGAGPALPDPPTRFVGRRQELVDIAEALAASRTTILHGVRGVGKTALAREAVHRAARRFARIVWVRARVEAPSDALSGATSDPMLSGRLTDAGELIARVADGLGLPAGGPREELIESIRREANEQPTLLVLDNLDSFAQKGPFDGSPMLRDLLACLPASCRVLITVAGDLDLAGRRVHVVGLPPEVGALLAHVYAQELGTPLSAEEAGLVGSATGGHPMAIRYAVGLIGREATRREVLDGLRGRTGRSVDEVLEYVMATAVEAASPDARLLYLLASHFPSPLPKETLRAGALWPQPARFDTALAEAVDLMLLELTAEGEWVLLQELPRARAARLEETLPEGPAHGAAMVAWAEARGLRTFFCGLVTAWEVYCTLHGHLREWEPAGREAVTVAHDLGDARRERIALQDLGQWYLRTGDLPEALSASARCAALARAEADDLAEAAALGSMGLVYTYQEEFARALECHQQAYDIAVRLNNPRAVATHVGNMGNAHFCQGELARALECHQQAYEIDVRLGSPQGQAEDLGNMGSIYARQGELARALECHQQAYEIDVRLGNPLGQAEDLGNMGLVYLQQHELAKARQHLQQAQALYRKVGVKGPGPEAVAQALEILAAIEKAMAAGSGAEPTETSSAAKPRGRKRRAKD